MKKRSVLGIIISIIMSIVLVPFIWATQILATTTMTISSVVKEERKYEIFSTFMQNNGGEWIYDMVKPVLDEVVAEYATEIDGLQTEDLLTVDDTNKILTGFYEKAVNGEIYEVDLTFLADRIKPQLEGIVEKEIDKQIDAQADTEIETYVDENLESIYASLSDDVKAQIKEEIKPTVYEEGKKTVLAEVEKEFDAQIDELVEEEVDKYIKENYPDQFIIADAKRGDIGNTSAMYARTFFEELNIDSVTVAPYMGEDSVTPFLTYEGKWVILLALTSNKGSHDFQLTEDTDGERLFEKVLRKSQEWANDEQMMYVVGATQGRAFEDIRKIVPNHFLLVPGVGAQGGSLEEVCKYGMNSSCGLIVNSSRGIIYVDKTEKFAEAARKAAQEVQMQMEKELKRVITPL